MRLTFFFSPEFHNCKIGGISNFFVDSLLAMIYHFKNPGLRVLCLAEYVRCVIVPSKNHLRRRVFVLSEPTVAAAYARPQYYMDCRGVWKTI